MMMHKKIREWFSTIRLIMILAKGYSWNLKILESQLFLKLKSAAKERTIKSLSKRPLFKMLKVL